MSHRFRGLRPFGPFNVRMSQIAQVTAAITCYSDAGLNTPATSRYPPLRPKIR